MSHNIDTDFDEPLFADSGEGSGVFKVENPAVDAPPVTLWFVVCTANMIIPAILATTVTKGPGWLGLALGVIVVYWIGYRACFTAGDVVRKIACGACAVMIPGILPWPQLIAGLMGIWAAGALGLTYRGDVHSFFGGLLATLITAVLLISFAGFLGAITRGRSRPTQPKGLRNKRAS